jgi:rod shape determining protein RodA
MLALFIPLGVILAAGLAIIASVSTHLFLLQLAWVGAGVAVLVLFYFVDWGSILSYRWVIIGLYVLSVALLVFVILQGPVVRNAASWILLGPFSFQPIELMKVALILLYANYFSRRHVSIGRWKYMTASFMFFIIPAGLVALQPNLGSALILFGLWYGTLLVSGLPLRRVLASLAIFLVAGALLWTFGLKDYQKARIEGFLTPNRDTLGINYNAAQSRIAIGSGGFWGNGFGQGSQTQLGFLPVPESDFAFAAFIEEWGFFGAFVVLAAFLFLIFRILAIGNAAERNFGKYICYGAAIMFTTQFLINSGSVTGLLPVMGIPMPFFSYGGSSLVANFVVLSLVDFVRRRG